MPRIRKPTALKLLAGVTAPCLVNYDEPKAPLGSPPMPVRLDGPGRHFWKTTCRDLDSLGVLSKVDGATLALACDAFSDYIAARQRVELRRQTKQRGGKPGIASVKDVGMMERAREFLLKTLGRFGLNPADRTRLHATAEQDLDDADHAEYIRRMLGG